MTTLRGLPSFKPPPPLGMSVLMPVLLGGETVILASGRGIWREGWEIALIWWITSSRANPARRRAHRRGWDSMNASLVRPSPLKTAQCPLNR